MAVMLCHILRSGSPEIARSTKCKPPAEETKENKLPPVQRSHDPRRVTFWEALNSLSSYNGPTDEFLPTGGTLKESYMEKVLSAYNVSLSGDLHVTLSDVLHVTMSVSSLSTFLCDARMHAHTHTHTHTHIHTHARMRTHTHMCT